MIRALSYSAVAAFALSATTNGDDLPIREEEEESIHSDGMEVPTSSMELPSSCLGAEDGYQWMKMLDGDDYPAVHQMCNNEYMVIDINEDSNVVDYFSSYTIWHHALGGPELMDHANWEEWWLPNQQFLKEEESVMRESEFYSYVISPDCNSCALENNDELNIYAFMNEDDTPETLLRTAYHMTSTLYGCQGKVKPLKELRWDYDSYECSIGVSIKATESETGVTIQMIEDGDLKYKVVMKSENETKWEMWTSPEIEQQRMGACGVYPYSVTAATIAVTRDECNDFEDESGNMEGSGNLKPSIGNKGSFCVCVKPNESYDAKTKYTVSSSDFEQYQADYKEQHTETVDTSSVNDLYELYQTDFETGTYRIQQSGTYKIMEDITFDFNAGDVMNPSAGSSWWPTDDQTDDYPGWGTTRDEYYLGFIAGITIEADDVVIDLNDFEIKMSEALYYQQRFFACIAIKSVTFPPDQGPGFFGFEAVFPNNVVIKDGVVGLSSHFGIHGHNNDNVTIENVHVHSFETHGIEMSYFNNLKMINVEIGPSSTTAKLKGEYGYARWTVQALQRLLETGEYEENMLPLTFDGRDKGLMIEDVIATLEAQMDMAFKHVMGVEEYDDDDAEWAAAEALFVNPSGLPYGAVMYGLFLNLKFANVFTMHPSLHHSKNAYIENLKVHDLHHKTMEYVRLDRSGNYTYQNQFAGPLDARAMLGSQIELGSDDIVWADTRYVGNALTDALLMLNALTEDWGELGQSLVPDVMIDWVLGEDSWNDDISWNHPYLGCNVDRMGHIPKGLIGIRMDGVEDVVFENLEIYNLQESSPLGSELCGEYWESVTLFEGGGNVFQNTPYYSGYTGNRVHGIFSDWSVYTMKGDINLHDFVSDTGLIRGLGFYTHNEMTWDTESTLTIANFAAGNELTDVDTSALSHPYANSTSAPVHCIWKYFQNDYSKTFYSTVTNRPQTVDYSCISGRDGEQFDAEFGTSYTSDNTDCSAFSKSNLSKDTMVSTRRSVIFGNVDSAIWPWTVLAVVIILGLWTLCRATSISKSKIDGASSEYAPLITM